jgi:hypothetical protein
LSIVLDQLGAAKTDEMVIKRINQMMPSMQERVQELVASEEELLGLRITQKNFEWQAHVNTVMSQIWTQSAAFGHGKAIELKMRLEEVDKELKESRGQVDDLERQRGELVKLRITIERLEAENLTLLNFKTLYSDGQADLDKAKIEIANLCSQCHDLRSLLASEEELKLSKKKHIRELTEELKATKVKFDHANEANTDRSLLLSSMRNLMFAVQEAFSKLVYKIEGAGDAGGADGVAVGAEEGAVGTAPPFSKTESSEENSKLKERERELTHKLDILEKQLGKSEQDRSKADLELTKRLVLTMNSTDQEQQLRNAMNDLREQLKKFLNGQNADISALQDKVSNLELGMQQLEAACAAK